MHIVFVFCALSQLASAQSQNSTDNFITGIVTDSINGGQVINATVITSVGDTTYSDFDGLFQIRRPVKEQIVFTVSGYGNMKVLTLFPNSRDLSFRYYVNVKLRYNSKGLTP